MQVKKNADVYLDRFVSNDHRERETVKKELIQLGVQSVHVAEVFSSPGNARLVHRFGLTLGLAFDLRTGWDLNDPAQRANMWSHLQHERPILIVGNWSGHGARTSITHEVDDGHIPLASCSRTFLCTPTLWTFASSCRHLCNEIDFGVLCRLLEDVHHEL